MPKSSALNDTPCRTVEPLVQPLRVPAAAHPRERRLNLEILPLLYTLPEASTPTQPLKAPGPG